MWNGKKQRQTNILHTRIFKQRIKIKGEQVKLENKSVPGIQRLERK